MTTDTITDTITDTGAAAQPAATATSESQVVGIELCGTSWRRIDDAGGDLDITDGYFDQHPVYAGIREISLDGLALIRIPAFYVRTETVATEGEAAFTRRWHISATARDGFALHPAFRGADGPRAAIHIGKYAAGKGTGPTFTLAAGDKPWTSLNFEQAASACTKMGQRCRLWSVHDLSAIQLLMLVEMGGADMQKLIGMGNVNGRGPVGGGESDAGWRGLCELWGNVWQMLEGLAINSTGDIQLWRHNDPAGGWIDTRIPYGPGQDDGYPLRLHDESGEGFDLGPLFLPASVSDDQDEAAIPDYCWAPWNNLRGGAWVGGSWIGGRDAGPFHLDLLDHRSDARPVIGFRPAFDI
jgi:hypothetical protein